MNIKTSGQLTMLAACDFDFDIYYTVLIINLKLTIRNNCP